MKMNGAPDTQYVSARRALLDALEALGEHRQAVLLVGAQAVYLHTGEGELAVAPFTSDADLAIDPRMLADDPLIEELMRGAGFVPAPEQGRIGTWIGRDGVPVDLLVPEALSGAGRRGARLGAHGNRVAHRARGLEAALIDNMPMTIGALEPNDRRSIEVTVAGPTALLVAKLHKIADRQADPRRSDDKDALDVYRLLSSVPMDDLVAGVQVLLESSLSQDVTQQALSHLELLFGKATGDGSLMAARAVEGLQDTETMAASCEALAQELLQTLYPRQTADRSGH